MGGGGGGVLTSAEISAISPHVSAGGWPLASLSLGTTKWNKLNQSAADNPSLQMISNAL